MRNCKQNLVKKTMCLLFSIVIIITTISTALILSVSAAPLVNITFNDTLNNTTMELSGETGSVINFPADPVDANGKNFFLGWFTDDNCRIEFKETVFGEEDVVLYSKWKSEYKVLSQDFENYTDDQFTVKDTNGDKTKSNRNYFFEGMQKQSEVTYGDSGYAVKMVWDSTKVKDPNDPATYNNTRYKSNDAKVMLFRTFDNHVTYNVSFKYKFEKADTAVSFAFYTAQHKNIWAYSTSCADGKLNTASTEWQEYSTTVTVNYQELASDFAVYFVFKPNENKDYTVYIDDFVFTPTMQPSDSTVTVVTNNGENNQTLIGKRGDSFTLPEVKNGDREFLGWYADEAFSVPFTDTVFTRKNLTAYAKWSAEPITFKSEHIKNALSLRAVYTLSLRNAEGVGVNDDYALNFYHDGDKTYQFSADPEPIKFSIRAGNIDNVIKITKVQKGKVYKVSYMRRSGETSESDYTIKLITAADNIWNNGRISYNDTTVSVPANEKEWIKETIYFIPDFTVDNANYLYMQFNSADLTDNALVDGYVDNVLVEEVTGNIVYFEANSNIVKDVVVSGNVGDEFEIPVIDNPEAQFIGWYADKELTVPFTSTTISEGFTAVYAKWGNKIMTFNNYPYTFKVRAPFTLSIKNGDGIGQNDKYALNFKYDADATYQSSMDSEPIKFVDRVNTKDNVAQIGTVEAGKVYLLSYYRRADKATNSSYSIVATTGGDNIWSGEYITYYGTKVVAKKNETDWVKETVYFMPTFTNTQYNLLYLQFNCIDNTESAFVDAYVDSVYLEEVTGNVVFFDGNGNNAKNTVVTGKIGDKFDLPTPVNGREVFEGWFTDKEFTTPYTSTTIDKAFTVVYAKWSAGPIAFDTYKMDVNTSSVTQFGQPMHIIEKDGYGYDDNFALNFDFVGSDKYQNTDSLMCDRSYTTHSAKLFKVENGKAYKMTYKYRVNKANAEFSMRLFSANNSNMWTGGRTIGASSYKVTDKNIGKWQEVSVVFATNFTKTASGVVNDCLYFNFIIDGAKPETVINVDIDNVQIVPIEGNYVYFDHTEGNNGELLMGKPGDKIAHTKTPIYFSYDLTNWYLDSERTIPFTQTTFDENTQVVVYAGWTPASIVTYTFENFDMPHYLDEKGIITTREAFCVTKPFAKSGKKVIEFKRTPEWTGVSFTAIAYDRATFAIDPKANYVVTVNYYVEKHAPSPATITLSIAGPNNYYAHRVTLDSYRIDTTEKEKKWLSASFVVSGSKIKTENFNGLYIDMIGGTNGKYYIDDVTIRRLDKGESAVAINSGNAPGMPSYIIGKVGASFANKLPAEAKYEGKYFKGYFIKAADGTYQELKREDMKLDKTPYMVYARFLNKQVVENFDDNAYSLATSIYGTLKPYDFDYEIYDSTKEGNSKDNVTSGNFSLHRKGESLFNEAAMLLVLGKDIAADERYTVTFKVKMGEHKHTEGAVKFVSCRTYVNPWATTGDIYPIVSIADLADGQWHEVSYTYNSVEPFASIITPGDVELFIDDVTFTLTPDAPLSTPIAFTEHVTETKDGTISLDATTIIDLSLTQNDYSLWIIIGVALAVVIVGGLAVIMIIKKKKSKAA